MIGTFSSGAGWNTGNAATAPSDKSLHQGTYTVARSPE